MEFADLTERVIAAALKVHSAIGPGVLRRSIGRASSTNYAKPGLTFNLKWLCRFCMMGYAWNRAAD
jgi:hypothetical protein